MYDAKPCSGARDKIMKKTDLNPRNPTGKREKQLQIVISARKEIKRVFKRRGIEWKTYYGIRWSEKASQKW